MNKIEQRMVEAARNHERFSESNTRVRVGMRGWIGVYLYDELLARVSRKGLVYPERDVFYNNPTKTTVSRLRALGVDCHGGNEPWVDKVGCLDK